MTPKKDPSFVPPGDEIMYCVIPVLMYILIKEIVI